MKELYLICAERENKPKCMECTWFKTDPNDLPDFGKCVRNHWNVISSDEACADFSYPNNSLSETCADYGKRCKEECEKKYRDEISKLQNIVTEKEVEIKALRKDINSFTYDRIRGEENR